MTIVTAKMTADTFIWEPLRGIMVSQKKPLPNERMVYMKLFTLLLSLMMPIIIPFGVVAGIVFMIGKKGKDTGASFVELPDGGGQPPEKPSRPPMNTSNILLLIGTAFIVLSGLAFGAAGWVHTSDVGRVLIVAAASAVSFLISVFMRRVMKLENTSTAFFCTGSLLAPTAVLTAGSYRLLGSWLSFSGDGWPTLVGLCIALVTTPCLIGRAVYKKSAFTYLGVSSAAFSVIFFLGQILMERPYSDFAAALIIVQLLLTALIHLTPLVQSRAVRITCDGAAVTYAGLAFISVFSVFEKAEAGHFIVLVALIAQLIFYGILKNKKWMFPIQSMLSVYTALAVTSVIYDSSDEAYLHLFWLSTMLVALHIANAFIPQIRHSFSTAATFIAAVIESFVELTCESEELFGLHIVMPIVLALTSYLYCFSKSKTAQAAAGLAAPGLAMFIIFAISDAAWRNAIFIGRRECQAVVIGIGAIIMLAAAALIMYLPKISFELHARHPRSSDTVLYTTFILTGIMLFWTTHWSRFVLIPLAAALLHIFLSNQTKNNITAVISGILVPIFISVFEKHYIPYESVGRAIVPFAVLIVYMALSRIFFRKQFVERRDGNFRIDFLLLSGWTAFTFMSSLSSITRFLSLIAAALYIACFVKKKTAPDTAAVLLTISAVITAYALITRPFLVFRSEEISSKIALGIAALTGLALRFIWRHHREAANVASSVVFISAFAGLILDAMYFHNAANTIFVLAVTMAILFIACTVHSKTWFTASSIALLTITVWSTRKYLLALNWWVYLFIAGMILIGAAAVNEYCKKNDTDPRKIVAKRFEGWRW